MDDQVSRATINGRNQEALDGRAQAVFLVPAYRDDGWDPKQCLCERADQAAVHRLIAQEHLEARAMTRDAPERGKGIPRHAQARDGEFIPPADQVAVWKTLYIFDDTTGTFCGISDLYFFNEQLFGVATGVRNRHGLSEDVGFMWRYIPSLDKFEKLYRFNGVKPEGITYNRDRRKWCLVFDNGSKNPSQTMLLKVSL